MDKTAIKNFAMQARNILRAMAEKEAGFYGVTKDGCAAPVQKGTDFETYKTQAGTENTIYGADIRRRASLKKAVDELGFEQVIEETAYTWFKRIIAIRFMEVNDYLPTRVRVLSSENGGLTPDIVSHTLDAELNLTPEEHEKVQKAKDANKFDEAYRILFIKQCNELNDILPGLFERTDDYMELLLKVSYTGDSVIRLFVDTVTEDNFNVETEGQVEIIGWMYQYYNSELKDDTFAKLKKNIKITKERIPAATQLFTPDWIVRYMVENSVGRVWIDHLRAVDGSVDEKAKAEEYGWKYYLPEAEQEEDVAKQLAEVRKAYKDIMPQDITCIDPCMGSGHILVYMFDVLMDIYKSEGYSERDAVFDILEKNIFGLDIDRRAYQLSYFALMMKGRSYGGRRFFRGKENEDGERVPVTPHVYAIEESNFINRDQLKYYGAGFDEPSKKNAIVQMNGLLDTLKDAKEYGSILNVENYDWKLLRSFVAETDSEGQMTFDSMEAEASKKLVTKLVEIGEILARKYDAVVTNPPYMGASNMSAKLSDFVKKNYPNTKSDMSTVCMDRAICFTTKNGYYAMINIPVWMFLSSYTKLRNRLLSENTISTMIHLGRGVFGADFGTTSFVIRNAVIPGYLSLYKRLFTNPSFVDKESKKNALFFSENNLYYAKQEIFLNITDSPLVYWLSDNMLSLLSIGDIIGKHYDVGSGLSTADNERFLRYHWEVSAIKIADCKESYDKKWFHFQKGGEFRRWYGNLEYVVNWENDGADIKYWVTHNPKDPNTVSWSRRIFNVPLYFQHGITWAVIGIGKISFRETNTNAMISNAAGGIFTFDSEEDFLNLLGGLNTKVWGEIFQIISPTVNYSAGIIQKTPVPRADCSIIVRECIDISREDWDVFETSWDFQRHPLVRDSSTVEKAYASWEQECEYRFSRLKKNEEKLNCVFIDIYGLQDEITPDIEDKDVTVRKAELQRDIRSLLSYAVGCMFGRYSLDVPGLVYAGGTWDSSKYKTFYPDEDAIIPICDDKYFEDDIVGCFVKFIEVIYGRETLEENLQFIAQALGGKGTSREIIRNYFINDFYSDHVKIYKKRPIYWLFDSGKQNGFKALIYIHRYTPDTVGLVRSVYLKKTSDAIEASLKNAEYIILENASAVDVAQATKKRDKYMKQLAEIKPYYQALSHVAMRRIPLDLDDGVKANYAKFQRIEVLEDGGKRQVIDLLAKI